MPRIKLLPCPWCMEREALQAIQNECDQSYFTVICNNCNACGPQVYYFNECRVTKESRGKTEARRAWNRRAKMRRKKTK